MTKRTTLIVLVVAAVLAGYWYWTNDERRIRRLLDDVADAVSQEEGAGVAGLAEVAGLTAYLAPDVTIEPGDPFRPLAGAQDVVSTVGRIRAVTTTVRLDISDVQVAVDGNSAAVEAAAQLTLRDRDGAESVDAREMQVTLEKRDAGWVITAARALRVIAAP